MNFGDATVETKALVDHTTTETGDYRYGLALRRSGDQYYAFTVSPRSKSWQITKHSPQGVTILSQGDVTTLQGFAPKGVTPDKEDDLRVDAAGSNFAFFINGRNVAHVSDADYATGDVGFVVETLDEPLVHAHYDSLIIRSPQDTAIAHLTPTATATPTPGPTIAPTATPLPATLPADAKVLIDTVLSGVVEQANNAEVDAILSGDNTGIDQWWNSTAHIASGEHQEHPRSIRAGDRGELEANGRLDPGAISSGFGSDLYNQRNVDVCGHGRSEVRRWFRAAPPLRGDLPRPALHAALQLKDGKYQIVAWQLGQSLTGEITTICP
jgi:hypothetical protein